jgi:nitric oxide reductase NorQ protein
MAWKLNRPLITVACHEDLSAGDLAGRWLLDAQGTSWQDGPLTLAVRHGGICYLDELVEARSDALVLLHPLADTRRFLPLDRHGEIVQAHPNFLLVVSYNPSYQSAHKFLKPSMRQRFTALSMGYPASSIEENIIRLETGIDAALAQQLVAFANRTRRLQDQGLDEGASTRLLVHAAHLMTAGLPVKAAVMQAVVSPLSDDMVMRQALSALSDASFIS